MQDSIKERARVVAGEHAARAIGAVRGGRQSDDQKPRRGIAERRQRLAPVFPIPIRAPFYLRHVLAVRPQPGAAAASDDFLLQQIQSGTIQPMQTPFRLDGRTALVTGGASGIGEATCRALSGAGASVIIVDIDRDRANALARELPKASAVILDITDEPAVAKALQALPGLDLLVNNAGIGLVGNVEETDLADFQRLFRVNVEGMFLMTKHAMPLLVQSKGSIVNIGSVAGLVGVKKRFAYCATKGAVVAMTRQIAVDYPTQVRVNCICPGTVDTPFVEAYLEKYHKHEKEKVRGELNQRQPVGRLGRPDEIAHLALYLCSKEAEFVNGSLVPIDGGWTAA